jgi:hypothetical protein
MPPYPSIVTGAAAPKGTPRRSQLRFFKPVIAPPCLARGPEAGSPRIFFILLTIFSILPLHPSGIRQIEEPSVFQKNFVLLPGPGLMTLSESKVSDRIFSHFIPSGNPPGRRTFGSSPVSPLRGLTLVIFIISYGHILITRSKGRFSCTLLEKHLSAMARNWRTSTF